MRIYTEKQKEQARQRYLKNREQILQKAKEDYKQSEVMENKREYNHNYYQQNKEQMIIQAKIYTLSNYEKVKNYQVEYRKNNKLRRKEYYEKNKVKINKQAVISHYIQKKTSFDYRIRLNLACRIIMAIKDKSGCKHFKTMEYVGCSLHDFKKYISKQFKRGMSWENYGKIWELDHNIPCSLFDLTIPEEQKKCFHYTNMKPMFKEQNKSKLNRYSEPTLSYLFQFGQIPTPICEEV